MTGTSIKKERPRVGVALSGGAAYGIAHIGVLQALLDNDIPVDCIAGTSAGAIVAAGFAFGVSLKELGEKAKDLRWYSISGIPESKLGLASNHALERTIDDLIKGKDINKANIPLAIVATDIESGEKVVFRDGKAALAVRASACLPGLFTPVLVDNKKIVDGGLVENLPLSPLRDMDADIKIGVNVLRWHSRKEVKNIIDVMVNSVSILASHQRHLVPQNVDILIEPDLVAYTPSDFKKADALIKEGYRAAESKVPDIKEMIEEHSRKRRKKKHPLRRFLDWFTK